MANLDRGAVYVLKYWFAETLNWIFGLPRGGAADHQGLKWGKQMYIQAGILNDFHVFC